MSYGKFVFLNEISRRTEADGWNADEVLATTIRKQPAARCLKRSAYVVLRNIFVETRNWSNGVRESYWTEFEKRASTSSTNRRGRKRFSRTNGRKHPGRFFDESADSRSSFFPFHQCVLSTVSETSSDVGFFSAIVSDRSGYMSAERSSAFRTKVSTKRNRERMERIQKLSVYLPLFVRPLPISVVRLRDRRLRTRRHFPVTIERPVTLVPSRPSGSSKYTDKRGREKTTALSAARGYESATRGQKV